MKSLFEKLFGNRNIKRLEGAVLAVRERGTAIGLLSDEELKNVSLTLKRRISEFADPTAGLTEVLPEAFALVREAASRTLKQRHYDVQLMGGIALHEGNIAQMGTGEGKTLVATLPAYLNALTGNGVHVITVNDYLAKRDAVWMGQVYYALGLSVSCISHDSAFRYDPSFVPAELDQERDLLGTFKIVDKFLRPVTRKEAYEADITYGTNHEFGFDYLRDNLTLSLTDRVQRGHAYAIIDEVDSILIDEARTPLIIAAPDRESSEYYRVFAHTVEKLDPSTDYDVDEKLRTVNVTDSGIEKVEHALGIQNIFSPENSRLVHFLHESLKAHTLFKRDKEYLVKDGEILIVDEFTGRVLHGRRYSGGLHQAIEAKEGVMVNQENRTYAQITIQNYFRLYKKISGMTGTADTSAEEFHKVYGLEVVTIPPNRTSHREDLSDLVYKTKAGKYHAIAAEVKRRHELGQPVLIGTTSISNNEIISTQLSKTGVPHEVLNAKNNEREGAIIAQAGRKGSVTVATNMAGRGVDIILGGTPYNEAAAKSVMEIGGLHVVGTERHEARRIDNQLRGRAGRQGDPGSTQFFLSLEDDLLRIFGGDRIAKLMQTLNFPEDLPIESKMVNRAVNQSQGRVEGNNFDLRKHLLDFDDVLNKQRTALYGRRTKLLEAGGTDGVLSIVRDILEGFVDGLEKTAQEGGEEARATATEARKRVRSLPETLTKEQSLATAHHLVRILDALWVEHLENLDALRESVNIRAYAQHEPLVEYRREAHILYHQLNAAAGSLLFSSIFQLLSMKPEDLKVAEKPKKQVQPPEAKELGRNDPCWCGSGQKFKKCHGK